ncbi:MAG: hypothetical protein H6Q89_4930 [Myxococcaceae bacterium]|nr:hypothetical protein [Myxococcaceae bacterium]
MTHPSKMLLLKAATALVVIGLIALVVITRTPALRPAPEEVPLPPEPVGKAIVPPAAPRAELPPSAVGEPAADPEDQLRQRAEQLLDRDPAAALTLLAEGDARFPRGRHADERVFLRLQAMVNLDQVADARVLATQYLELNPHSPQREKISRLLGIHLPPPLPTQ